MLDLLLRVLPLAIASAVSPVILGVTISVLAGKNYPKQRAFACLAGAALTVLMILAAGAAIGTRALSFSAAITQHLALPDIGLGLIFLAFGFHSLISAQGKLPDISAGAKAAQPRLAAWFAVGFTLNITNLDAVFLYLTETREIFQAAAPFASQALLALLGALFFLSPTLLPIAAYIAMGEREAVVLGPVRSAMEKYGKYAVFAVFVVFGAYMLWRGITLLGI